MKIVDSALFVTLTYQDHLLSKVDGYPTLVKSDLQKFFKRLRHIVKSDQKVKYYACGEYGGVTLRPHYHIVLMNAEEQEVIDAWTLDGEQIGIIHFGKVEKASIYYTVKYMQKGCNMPYHKCEKPFSLMSKGIGSCYLTDAIKKYHKEDINRSYVLEGKKKVPMPRYYKERIYDENERKLIAQLNNDRITTEEDKRRMQYIEDHGTDEGFEASLGNDVIKKLQKDEFINKTKKTKL